MIQPSFPMVETGRVNAFPMIGGPARRHAGAIAKIQREVARFYDLPPLAMIASRRGRDVAHPRQVAMYLAKELTPQSLPEIGKRFGNRDHTTILHGIRAVRQRMDVDEQVRADVQYLLGRLGA